MQGNKTFKTNKKLYALRLKSFFHQFEKNYRRKLRDNLQIQSE